VAGLGCFALLGLAAALLFGFGFFGVSPGGRATPMPGVTPPTARPTATVPEDFPLPPPWLSNDISVVTKNEPYAVTGSSAAEIRKNLNSAGPSDETGHHDAMTRWFVRWSYPFERGTDRCATGPVSVSVTVRMQMPNWAPPPNAPADLSQSWDHYLKALRHHEDGHKNHGLLAARDVLEKLKRLGAEDDCQAMNVAANAAANRILDEYRVKDRSYDERTRHGATQGAIFP
jgi:predicted secreted Zn-dependent protease